MECKKKEKFKLKNHTFLLAKLNLEIYSNAKCIAYIYYRQHMESQLQQEEIFYEWLYQ